MKKLWKLITFLIKAAAAVFILSLAVVVSVPRYNRPVQKADAIIVLGAAINTEATYNRSLEGLRLYQAGDAPVMVLSGGVDYPKSIPEAQYMENVILANSSTTPKLLLDTQARSTFENIANSKKLLPGAKSVIIVSDTFHIARAALTAKAAGFSPVYWSSPNTDSNYPPGQLVYYYLREALALLDYLPKFVFKTDFKI